MGTRIGIGVQVQRQRKAGGDGPPAPPPLQLPGKAGAPTLTSRTADSITVGWNAPADGGAPASYRVRYSTDAAITDDDPSVAVTETGATISGLEAGTDYWIDVIAVNATGDGPDSDDLEASTLAAERPPAQEAQSNYRRIAAIPGAYAVRFIASLNHIDLFEVTPAEGTELDRTPATMYVDPAAYWLERIRSQENGAPGSDDGSNVYVKAYLALHRGASTVSQSAFLGALSAEWSWVLINETTEEWIMWPAANPGNVGGGYVIYTMIPTFIADTFGRASSDVDAIAQSFGDGETATAAQTFQNALPGSELVLALIPDNTFRPAFPAQQGDG